MAWTESTAIDIAPPSKWILNDSITADGWMDGWLGFNGILSTQVAAISCLRKFKVC